MTIYLGADHGGFPLKEFLKNELMKQGYIVEDCGAFTLDPTDDYPVYAQEVARKVLADPGSFGILLCRSGAGMEIAANRFKGIRAVECHNVNEAIHARQHNDANIVVLGADEIDGEKAERVVKTFLETAFNQEERHIRRIEEIEQQ